MSIFLIVAGLIALIICFGGQGYQGSEAGSGWPGQIINGLARMDEFTRLLTGIFCGVFPLVFGTCGLIFDHLGISFKDKV